MIIGGRQFDKTKEQVEQAMRGEKPEPIRQHLVEMLDSVFPPKQVLATATGWDRSTFTTMEAQRALIGLGFVCRRAERDERGRDAWVAQSTESTPAAMEGERTRALEAGLATAMEAIANLRTRVEALEGK